MQVVSGEGSKVVTDQGLVTSRNPGDLDVFRDKLTEEIREGRHDRRAAA
jgi:protease I